MTEAEDVVEVPLKAIYLRASEMLRAEPCEVGWFIGEGVDDYISLAKCEARAIQAATRALVAEHRISSHHFGLARAATSLNGGLDSILSFAIDIYAEMVLTGGGLFSSKTDGTVRDTELTAAANLRSAADTLSRRALSGSRVWRKGGQMIGLLVDE